MKFRAGDWVKLPNGGYDKVYEITQYSVILSRLGNIGIYTDKIELWKPRNGEWCWYRTDAQKQPILFQWGVDDIEIYSMSRVEPFMGELPSFIKDK